MGSINYGSQESSIQYAAQVNSGLTENIIKGLIPTGIYSGGYVTATGANSVSISPLACSITDGNYQMRINTTVAVSLTGLASTNPTYIVLRWAYAASSTNYMDVLALPNILPNANDLVIAKLTGVGTSIAIDYTLRSNPLVFIKNLLVEPTESASMYVRIRAGKASFGPSTYEIVDQRSPLFTAPVTNPRIDVIGVDSTGTVVVVPGTEAASPVAPSYGTTLALAEITLQTSSTSITASMIRNVQNAARFAGNAVLLTGDQTVAGIKTFSGGIVIENRTSDPGSPATGRLWIRTDV
jgi:hypothetical protein